MKKYFTAVYNDGTVLSTTQPIELRDFKKLARKGLEMCGASRVDIYEGLLDYLDLKYELGNPIASIDYKGVM